MTTERRVALGAALAVVMGSGCDALRGAALPEEPLWLHHPGGAITIALRRPLTAENRQVGEAYERGRPEIDAEHRRVFVGSSDRGLYALRAEDATTLWRFETAGAVQSEPLYDPGEDVVYFGSNDGALYKVRAVDGAMLWRFATNAIVARRPVLDGGVVYATNANDTLLALDASSGSMKWNVHRTPAFGMEIAGYAGPAVSRGRVYAAFSDGNVVAYATADGSEQWTPVDLAAEAEQAAGDVPKYLDVDTTPIVDRVPAGDIVFVASYAGGVYGLDADSGNRVWFNDKATGVTDLVVWRQPSHVAQGARGAETGAVLPERHLLLASSGPTGLWALDPNDGHTVWRRSLPEGGISAPVPVAGALLLTSSRYGLFLLSPLTGNLIDGIETGGGFAMTPAAFGTRAYVMTNAGSLLSLHVSPPG